MTSRLCIWALAAVMLISPPAAAASQWQSVGQMIGGRDGIAVSAPGGQLLFAKNADKHLVPASTLKLLTAQAALFYLGPDFRFSTEFYLTPDSDLVIKGYGDPLLVSEQVDAISQILANRITEIHDLVLDDTYFKSRVDIPGTRAHSAQPYDAPVGALCVNFNTVHFKKAGGTYVSAEPQTPLLPAARERIRQCRVKEGRVLLSANNNENLRYAGELFAHFLANQGLATSGQIRPGQADPETDRLVYRYESPFFLTGVIARLMEFSNNFIANQIMIRTGVRAYGPPGTLEKGVRAVRAYAQSNLGISPKIVEGSGISRQNRMSARMFMPVLAAFSAHFRLLPQDGDIFCKTGTLDGIRTRAGYIEKNGALYPFAVLMNTPGRNADAVVEEIAAVLGKLQEAGNRQ